MNASRLPNAQIGPVGSGFALMTGGSCEWVSRTVVSIGEERELFVLIKGGESEGKSEGGSIGVGTD